MTPMFIQEPFWNLTLNLPNSFYITVNKEHAILPEQIEARGLAIKGGIAENLEEIAHQLNP